MDINNCTVTGRLTADAELSQTNNNTPISKFRIANNDRRKDHTNFLNVVCFGKQAEILSEFLKKGKLVGVDGKIEISQYEKDGEKRESFTLIANNIHLGPRTKNEEESGE